MTRIWLLAGCSMLLGSVLSTPLWAGNTSLSYGTVKQEYKPQKPDGTIQSKKITIKMKPEYTRIQAKSSSRDAASGMATGRRVHEPIHIRKELGASTGGAAGSGKSLTTSTVNPALVGGGLLEKTPATTVTKGGTAKHSTKQ
jgi:hypothetical protein